jgi:large subunit ribosomal protein L19e
MILKLQKRLAASILHCSEKRVVFDPARTEDIKEAITKTDIRLLIGEHAIARKREQGVSRARANKRKIQRSKGLRRGAGSRKGKATARNPQKKSWISSIRAQRSFLKDIKAKGLIPGAAFKELYSKSKGGFFRSIKHIKLYINEHNMILKPRTYNDKKRVTTKK